MKRLKGIVPVLVTTFNKDQTIDHVSLRRVTQYILRKGPGGFWVLGTGGEDMNLTFEERLQVAQTVTETVAGKVPVMLGCGFYAKTDIKNYIRETRGLNFDAYHLMPYHTLMSLDRYESMYKDIADLAEKPVWLYTSANYCRHFPPEFIECLIDHPNIAGIKYSTSNIVHMEKALSYSREDFQVISAVVRQFLPSLSLGVEATTTVEGCFYFEKINRIYQAFMAAKFDQAVKFQRELNRFLEKTSTGAGKDNFLKSAEGKYVLSKLGLCQTYMSGDFREVNALEEEKIDSVLMQDPDFLSASEQMQQND
jgi:dihydrodipicolinate synthase/N-acetylneuraminate lyase